MDTRWIDQEGIDLEQVTLGKQLRNFLDEEGRLTAFPAKRKMKHLALAYLAGKFQPGARYTEKEINQLLEQWHVFHDPATLRWELYHARLLDRKKDGSLYWLAEERPECSEDRE